MAQLHVRQLKLRIDKVIKENAENFTSENSSIVDLGELLANCGPSSYMPPVNGENSPLGSLLTTSQQTSQKKTVMPTSVVSGHTEVYKVSLLLNPYRKYLFFVMSVWQWKHNFADLQKLGSKSSRIYCSCLILHCYICMYNNMS